LPIWTSLSVRYQLASGNESEAKRICREYYASQDSGAGSVSEQSLEMAFAKLDVLLADSSEDAEVARWIEFIERSGGAFARRRAEAIAIRQFRSDGLLAGDSGKPRVSPSLIAAQGEDLLRRDDPGKAATFLREAALAEPSAEAAFAYAAKSAAASIAAADTEEAINVLRDTASRHASNAAAPNLMMQAALLASQPFQQADDPKKRLELLEEVLKEISQTWATSDVAAKANDWLCRILVQTDRPGEAAQAALELLTLGRRPDQLAAVSTLWFDYLSKLDRQEVSSNLNFLSAALNEIADESKSLADPIRQLSVWFFDRQLLSERSADLIGDDVETEFLRKLARFRVSGQGMISDPESIGSLLRRRVRWRLERDAMLDASLQKSIGKVLSDWPGSNAWDKAAARLWSDQDDAAIESIKRLAVLGDQNPRSLRRGMELLAQSQSIDAKKAAVKLADRLAAVMQIKSKEWYLVKLQAITWLNQIGQSDESRKRAKFVLLLHRPEETGLRERFEKYAAE
jgi:hypothetical protein